MILAAISPGVKDPSYCGGLAVGNAVTYHKEAQGLL